METINTDSIKVDNDTSRTEDIKLSHVNQGADLNETTTSEARMGGIKEFIAQTTMIGNVIAAAASQKNSSEPLPFTDYSQFEETYGIR